MAQEENPYANEKVIEYGEEDVRNKLTGEVEHLPFVITETSPPFDPNNKARAKYYGADIPGVFIHQVQELEEEKREKDEFEEWKKNRNIPFETIDVTPDKDVDNTLGL